MQYFVLTIHVVWLLWMVGGIAVALLAISKQKFRRMALFRTAHLIGLLGTATVPVWADGICPLTQLEGAAGQRESDPLLMRIFGEILYWEVSPLALSVFVGFFALLTLVLYFWRPPWN